MPGEMQMRGQEKQGITTRVTHSVQDTKLNTDVLYCRHSSHLQPHWGLRRNKSKIIQNWQNRGATIRTVTHSLETDKNRLMAKPSKAKNPKPH